MTDLALTYGRHHSNTERLKTQLENKNPVKCHLRGLSGSSVSFLAAGMIRELKANHLFILNDKEEAAYFFNDLENLLPGNKIFFFPSPFKRQTQNRQTDPAGLIQRTELLDAVLRNNAPPLAVVTYPESIAEMIIRAPVFDKIRLELVPGESVSRDFLVEALSLYGFKETDFVYEPGDFAIRGSIVDVFSFSCDQPYRIDFFGDEVESVRFFDIETQLSEKVLNSASIIPNIQEAAEQPGTEDRVSVISLLEENTLLWTKDIELTLFTIDEMNRAAKSENNQSDEPEGSRVLLQSEKLLGEMMPLPVIEFGQTTFFRSGTLIEFNTSPQPSFNKNFKLLAETLENNTSKGYTNYIFSENEKQFERLRDIFTEISGSVPFTPVSAGISEGFTDHDLRKCFYTDHQIFERYHKFRIRESFKKREEVSLKTIHDLQPGDYIVHIDHGIGKYGGLEKIVVNGKNQEALKLVYKDGDTLYVNIHALHRISKYKGKDGIPPKIYKLGSGAWQKLKQKTSNKVKDIARELIALYAKRKMEKGFSFSADTYLQRELEASFIYEDTPDQLKATNMVKEQMESTVPMDMLVCGDVGFGKTEVAIRAAFKAVSDNKQVAVLVPTTILALQHYNTFSERLKDFPCTVDHLSRLRPVRKQKELVGAIAEGKVDIVIGTHRILGQDIRFRDMGLLIIDEEQKFGVSVKEKLKRLKLNVDTLTLTATPIPRTLQFSLMGARDLSIINTPPPNRHPILTGLHQFDRNIIREAIEYEIRRAGQVFFIHNRIENIKEIEAIILKECPGVKTVVAHGRMEGSKLEKIMLAFISGEYDVLIATTIIESGLDIPNANTIIINNAHHFGLSDLHQLRGRVGRSNKKAFCYLLSPPPQLMTREARQRLKAIEDFSELGSGFNIAMQDLDIRGAGNLLGREQSGFIADIGFETYHKILDDAVRELRETEFRELFSREVRNGNSSETYIDDCQVDTDLELLLPEEYIPGNKERIRLYRTLDNIRDEESLISFRENLIDRFGPVPHQTTDLLNIVRIRRVAIKLGFEKILLKNGKMIAYFLSNQDSPYYKSTAFSEIIKRIQQLRNTKLREHKNRLMLSVQSIDSAEAALDVLKNLEPI